MTIRNTMSLVSYTNYTSYKPVANLNAKVKRLVKKTKKVEEKPEFRFFPRNAQTYQTSPTYI